MALDSAASAEGPTRISHTSGSGYPGGYYFRALDDIGGWAQLKEKRNERLEFNAAYWMDKFSPVKCDITSDSRVAQCIRISRLIALYQQCDLAPSAYILFSLEYRRLESSPVVGLPAAKQHHRPGAGYKF